MLLGYARISTNDQNFDLQIDALTKHGCKRFYKDTVSGAKSKRPGLDEMLKEARPKDIIVIWKLDRLGRSLKHLVDLVAELNERDIGLRSLNDPIDTTTAQGRLVFNIFASLAEFEREIIRERTNAGLAAARARGRTGGRKPGLSEDAKRKARIAQSYYEEGMAVNQITKSIGISKATLYRYLRFRGVQISHRSNSPSKAE